MLRGGRIRQLVPQAEGDPYLICIRECNSIGQSFRRCDTLVVAVHASLFGLCLARCSISTPGDKSKHRNLRI